MQKILLIRFSSIGDIILCSVPIRSLKSQYPGLQLHFVTKEAFFPWAKALPHVDRVISFDGDLKALRRLVLDQSYDLIVDLHNNIRSCRLCVGQSAPVVRAPRESWQKFWSILTRRPTFKYTHVVHKYMSTLAHLGLSYDGLGLDIRGSSQSSGAQAIVVALGGSAITKRVPVKLAFHLASSMPHESFVWIGGQDLELTDDKYLMPNVQNLIGKLSVEATIALIYNANLLITGDTGIMHIGAAYKKKMIVLWGSTHPDFGFSPLYPNNAPILVRYIQVDDLACRPCSRHGRKKCPLGHMRCINDISANKLALTTKELLSLNH